MSGIIKNLRKRIREKNAAQTEFLAGGVIVTLEPIKQVMKEVQHYRSALLLVRLRCEDTTNAQNAVKDAESVLHKLEANYEVAKVEAILSQPDQFRWL